MYPLPPQVNTALTLLNNAGHEAFVVGGAVRDLLRGGEVHDWDVTTSALPDETAAVFAGHRLIETGLKHGTVTVLMDGMPLEITTYRTEGNYSDHRRPDSVAFTRSLEEDLARRDFTINAMAYHPETGVIDPFGGEDDLRKGVLRCVGDPDRRFDEDALRILRCLRFASRFGMTIEAETAAAIHRNRDLLTHIAAERIQTELTGLLCGSCAEPVLREYADVLAVPIPEITPMLGFEQRNPYHCHDVWEHTIAVVRNTPPQPILRWAALFHDMGKPASFSLDRKGIGHFYGHGKRSVELSGAIMSRLRFDNATRSEVRFLVEHHDDRTPATEDAVKRAIQRFGARRLGLLIPLFRADILGQNPDRAADRLAQCDELATLIQQVSRGMDRFTVKDLAIGGNDLLALGYQGPRVGQALDGLVNAVVFEGVENNKEALLRRLAEQPLP